jgi:hypothetical protein
MKSGFLLDLNDSVAIFPFVGHGRSRLELTRQWTTLKELLWFYNNLLLTRYSFSRADALMLSKITFSSSCLQVAV